MSTVTRTVARLRREAAAEREAGFLDLSWHPGECQADFGCFASMFVRQVRQCFSVVWADGFPRCRHRFPVM